MKFQPKQNTKRVGRFQEGGPMPAEDPAMAQDPAIQEAPAGPEQAGGDPLMQIAQIFMQGLQNQDCNLLAQGAQAFLQLLQQAQGGGAPQGAAPEGEPVFRKGGQLLYRVKRK